MESIKRTLIVFAILLIPLFGFLKVSQAAEVQEYISDVKVVSALSEAEAVKRLKEAGYTPIMTNIASEKPEMAASFVYLGYRTTTDPAGAMELKGAGSTGSVFGESALMIGGIAMILGVAVGMISMRIRPKGQSTKVDRDK